MKKLTIVFKDKTRISYKMRDAVSHWSYFNRHSKHSMESAVLQKYPLIKNEPIKLV